MQHATGLVTVLNKGGTQGFVALLQGVEAAQQGLAIECAFKPQRRRNVVRGAVRVELPEQPLALLRIRQNAGLAGRTRAQWRLTEGVRL